MTLEVPLELLDSLEDPGTWRELGVTHWHCVRDEQPITVNGRPNEARFNTDRIRLMANERPNAAPETPREALGWLVDHWVRAINDPARCPDPSSVLKQRLWHTDELWHQQLTHTWQTLTTSATIPAGCGLQLRPNQSLDLHCYPMTAARCRRPH